MNLKYKSFLFGYLFCIGSEMFNQDMMGLEKYINYISAGWVELSPVWGFLLMITAIVLVTTERSS